MDIHSDSLHTDVKLLSNKALNIPNLLYIGGDLNIRNSE